MPPSMFSQCEGCCCIRGAYSQGRFRERKKLTMAKAEAHFSHPHSPWERPTNENTNGLLHPFSPKSTSFLTGTQEHLDHAIHLLNNRPRKSLNWKTPYPALAEELLYLV